MFGILSMITVLAMLTFSEAHTGAQDRVAELRADSAAERVASAIVDVALFAEDNPEGNTSRRVDLPQQLEAREYTTYLWTSASGAPPGTCDASITVDRVLVWVPGISYCAEGPLFSASAPSGVSLCESEIPGGSLVVVLGENGTPGCLDPYIFLSGETA